MADVDSGGIEKFMRTGRTGRRNALHDILDGSGTTTGAGNLPSQLAKLKCSDEESSENSAVSEKDDSKASSENDKKS
ncbi:DgyrCDS3749 [Dimorphilus gyrociliatus]|uniref:DgyrCDS3749 n=1 Tax=Dimorphilus gyrociliatus TaxID=2664684 RepID=A0A7I8VEW3_9ANNE|nr:DgyrCDS3749 [Dimorphilus gyrociliatus]